MAFRNILADVKAFHDACDIFSPNILVQPPQDRQDLRHNLISEEVIRELLPAIKDNNIVEIADACADSIYVIVGTALEYGATIKPEYSLPECGPGHSPGAPRKAIVDGFLDIISYEVQQVLLPYIRQSQIEVLSAKLDACIELMCDVCRAYSIPLDRVWDAVQAANMAKVDAVTGKVIRREDGKILKPVGRLPPDINAIILSCMPATDVRGLS